MGSIRQEFTVDADADRVWTVVGDWESGPAEMARGFVTSSRAAGAVRVVTFTDGAVARERLVARDDDARRIVYSVIGDAMQPEHDNAVMQVVPEGPQRCRFVWSRDVLPDELVEPMRSVMAAAAPFIRRSLEDR